MADLAKTPRREGWGVTYDQPVASAAIEAVEASVGGRKALIASLLSGPTLPDDLAYVVGLIADPRNDARKLGQLCAQGGVTLGEVLEAYKRGAMAAGQVQAVRAIAEHIGPVIEDAMARARPHDVPCEDCTGTGSVSVADADPVPCVACKGTGVRRILPELDRQKFAADLGRLLPKKTPLIDQSDRRSLTVGPDPSPAGLVKILHTVDATLHGKSTPVVDAEPAPDPKGAEP